MHVREDQQRRGTLPLSTLSAVAESSPVRKIVAEALLEALVPTIGNILVAYRGKARCRAGRKCSREPGASACAPSAAMRSCGPARTTAAGIFGNTQTIRHDRLTESVENDFWIVNG